MREIVAIMTFLYFIFGLFTFLYLYCERFRSGWASLLGGVIWPVLAVSRIPSLLRELFSDG